MRDAKLLLGDGLALAFGSLADHGFLGGRERPRLVGEGLNRRGMNVGARQSRQRLYQVPRRTVDARLVARMNIAFRPAAPFLSARNQPELHNALLPQVDGVD